jgi:predicted nucleotidyltransferase
MRLQTLLEESEIPPDVVAAVSELVDLKARTRELGTGRFPPVLRSFVVAELTAADLAGTGDRRHDLERSRAFAAETFRTAVTRFNDLAVSPHP